MDQLDELRAIVGEKQVLDATEVTTRSAGVYRTDSLAAMALVRPANTAEVAAVMRWCHDRKIPVVTHGGLTGLVHGGDAGRDELIVSTERMRTIEAIDPVQRTATVQAGVVLQALQEAADAQDLFFPLDLGARGSATVGGNAATNAGGNRVIRYGMMREMVLGLEAVLADGTIVSSMHGLIKNNTGYDLKGLFVGSEGTLGVITRLVLRLREKPASVDAALVAFSSFDAVVRFLGHCHRSLGGALSAFEVMWQDFYNLVTTPPALGRPPVAQGHPFYALVENTGTDPQSDGERFAAALEAALEQGLIVDAAVSQSGTDTRAFWSLRDDVDQVMVGGTTYSFDISLPISRMEGFVAELRESLASAVGDCRLWIYGHLGDGNLHLDVQVGDDQPAALRATIERLVYAGIGDARGSVSAEHGIGLEKKPYLALCRSEAELAVMRAIKHALDPHNLLNRGKIL